MRTFRLALIGLLITSSLHAQQPQPAAPPAPTPARLDELLARWEKEMQGIQSLSLECVRTDVNKTFGGTDVWVGSVKFMKPNLARLELFAAIIDPAKPVTDPRQMKLNQEVYEKVISTGNFLYQFVPKSKEVNVTELSTPKAGQVADDPNMSFLSGMKADEAKKRYELKLVKEDQYYIYIELMPKLDMDKREFQKARLVLNQSNFLPRQIWYQAPNGNEQTWDIPKADANAKIERTEFAAPTTLPPGWKMVRAPRADAAPARPPEVAPRVVRPSGQ
jgi:TIGR03009 family protein